MQKPLPNAIDYLEIPTRDLPATKRFFAELFGWQWEDFGPDYACFDDGRLSGGFMTAECTSTIDAGSPLIVFHVADLEETLEKVNSLGGRILKEIFDFPGGRRFHFAPPGGGEFAIWSDR